MTSTAEMTSARHLTRTAAATGGSLAVAAVSGLLTLSLAGRFLGPAQFTSFASFWAVLFGCAGIVQCLEPESARLTAAVGASRALGRLLPMAALLAVAVTAALAASWSFMSGRALAGRWELLALVAVATLSAGVQGVVRGTLLVRGRSAQYGAMVSGEALIRLAAICAAGLAGHGLTLDQLAMCAAAGSFVWLGWLPLLVRTSPVWARPTVAAARMTGHLAASGLCTGVLVTGFPALAAAVTARSASGQLGVVLSALTLSRAPLLIFGPVQAMLVPALVNTSSPRLLLRRVRLALTGTGAVIVAASLAAGPAAVRLVYGPGYTIGAVPFATLALSALMTAALVSSNAALLAAGRHRSVALSWSAALAVTIAVLLLCPAPPGVTIPACLLTGAAAGELMARVLISRTVRSTQP